LETKGNGRLLDEIAPVRYKLAKGRVAKIEYAPGQPPKLSSRLQDFFGMHETPRIAKGKVPLVLLLLAPNQRPVQTTTELAGFWLKWYPQVRKELMRRYPRHAWNAYSTFQSMRTKIVSLLLAFSLVQQAAAQELKPRRGFWWKLSAAALTAATMVDAHSSWGHNEINPVLRGPNGRFGVQGLAMKALITTGVIGTQYFLLKRTPQAEKYGVITNFALAGVLGTAAMYNYKLQARPASSSNRR
jgi:hypothetical protein